MRLIDATALINEMKKWYWDKEKQRAAELDDSPMDLFTNLAIMTVKEQPIIYDIDKIIADVIDDERASLLAYICRKYNIPLLDMNVTVDEWEEQK